MAETTPLSQDTLNYEFLKALNVKDFAAAEQLLAQGADINHSTNLNSDTPLILFVTKSEVPVITWLLAHGADGAVRNEAGATALHVAIALENHEDSKKTFEALLAGNMPLDLPDAQGVRPLHLALNRRYRNDQAEQLLDRGVDIDTPTHMGTTPLMTALTYGKPTALRLLNMGAKLDAAHSNGNTVLHVAAESDDEEIAGQFIQAIPEADIVDLINRPSLAGTSPLAMAISGRGSVHVAHALLERGADPNGVSANRMAYNMTCLMVLVSMYSRRDKLVEAAQKKDADTITLARLERTVQLLPQTLALALEKGANPNARDARGASVLQHGLDNMDALRQLIAKGADPTQPIDITGISPYVVPLQKPDELREGQSEERRNLVLQAQADIRELFAMGFPLEPTAYTGKVVEGPKPGEERLAPTPLGLACRQRARGHVELLLELGANPNALGPNGQTALHEVAQSRLTPAKQLAAEKTKQAIAMTPEGPKRDHLVQQLAEMEAREGESLKGLVQALFDAGADLNLPNQQGFTPLAVAARNNQQDVIALFLSLGADPLATGMSQPKAVDEAPAEGLSALLVALKHAQAPALIQLLDHLAKTGQLEAANGTPDAPKGFLGEAVLSSPDGATQAQERHAFLQTLQLLGPSPWVDAPDADGNTPLILAAATEQSDVVEALLRMGANPLHANAAGETALMHAILVEDVNSVEILVKAGSDLTARNAEGVSIADLVHQQARYLEAMVVPPAVITTHEPAELSPEWNQVRTHLTGLLTPQPPAPEVASPKGRKLGR